MSAGEQLRAQALQARARLAQAPAVERAPVALPASVRQTVDLSGERHLAFNAWKLEAALSLGRSRPLTTQDTLDAMVAVLIEDESVARRVRAWLETQT